MIPINCALAKHQSFGSAVQCRCPCPVELSTELREVSQSPEMAPTRAFFLLKAPTNTFTIKNQIKTYVSRACNQ